MVIFHSYMILVYRMVHHGSIMGPWPLISLLVLIAQPQTWDEAANDEHIFQVGYAESHLIQTYFKAVTLSWKLLGHPIQLEYPPSPINSYTDTLVAGFFVVATT